jgi:hypothetical protein
MNSERDAVKDSNWSLQRVRVESESWSGRAVLANRGGLRMPRHFPGVLSAARKLTHYRPFP